MAVTQISRIQHRRGLEQDLPQLASAELGWSIDTRQLYIGNGTLDEGAPIIGVTRILTEHDIAAITGEVNLIDYTFYGNAAGYSVQTGPSTISPVVRTIQDKFDDIVNVRDFGAIGDGVADDTAAINRALQEIYKSSVSPTEPRARRTIYFPGGTYLITSTILIPPFAKLVGDGFGSSIIKQTNGNRAIVNLCDSSFQTGASIGSGSATYPQDIEINGLQFLNSNTNIVSAPIVIDSASNVKIQNSKFISNAAAVSYIDLVSVRSTVTGSKLITFDTCVFVGGGNSLALTGATISSVRVLNSKFSEMSNAAAHLGNSTGFVSIGNYIGGNAPGIISNGNNYNVELGNYYENLNQINSGLRLGNCVINPTQQVTLTTTPTVFQTLSNSAGVIDYEIKSNSNIRIGSLTIASQGATLTYLDNYTETPIGVGANISANSNSILVSVNSGIATYKFTYKQFI